MAEAKETQNILKQIYSSSSSMSKTSEGNTSTLESIYKLQLESEKRRKAAQAKAEREARRKLQDDKRDDLDFEKEKKKSEEETEDVGKSVAKKIGDAIKGLLGGIGGLLTAALAPLLPGILGALGGLKSGLLGALGKLGGAFGKGFGLLKGLIGPALGKIASLLAPLAVPALGVIAAAAAPLALASLGGLVESKIRDAINGGEDVTDSYSSVDKQLKEAGLDQRGRRIERRGSRYFTTNKARTEEQEKIFKAAEIQKNKITEIKKERKELNEKRREEVEKIKEKGKSPNRSGAVKLTDEQREEIETINRKYDELQEELNTRLTTITETDLKTVEVGGKENVEGAAQAPAPAPKAAPSPAPSTGRSAAKRRQTRVKRQSGGEIPGAFTVPGSGSGDQFPIDLPAGSFVLNRNASDVLRQGLQRGGMTRMVPTLLEPGERVFLPGQWDSGIAQLNRTFSRFQVGGEVSDSVQYLQSGGKTDIKSITTSNKFIDNSQRGGNTSTSSDTITTNLSKLINKLQEGGMTTFTGGVTDISTSTSSAQSNSASMVQQGDTSSISNSSSTTVGGNTTSSATNVTNTASNTNVANSSNTVSNLQQSSTNVANTSAENSRVSNVSSNSSVESSSVSNVSSNSSSNSNVTDSSVANTNVSSNSSSNSNVTDSSVANTNVANIASNTNVANSSNTVSNSSQSNTSLASTSAENSRVSNVSSNSSVANTNVANIASNTNVANSSNTVSNLQQSSTENTTNNTSSDSTETNNSTTNKEETNTKEGDVSNLSTNSSQSNTSLASKEEVANNFQTIQEITSVGGKVDSTHPEVPADPRIQSTSDFIQKETKKTVTQMLKSGGLVIFQGHGDVPAGNAAPGTDGPGTPLANKFKPTAEQHFVHQVATAAEALAKKQGAPLTYQRSSGKYEKASNPKSNWSQIKKHRAAGKSAVELHFDAYGQDRASGRFMDGDRGMLTGGQGSLLPEEQKLQQKFGTHPASGSKSWGSLMLELDSLKHAPNRISTYAKMLVDASRGDSKGPGPSIDAGEPVKVKLESGSARGEVPQQLKEPSKEQVSDTSGEQKDQPQEQSQAPQTGVKAIVAAAEKGAAMKIGKGQNMQCANTTRQVLRMAGHPDAGKTTKKGDLDAEGLKYSGATFAASFAGTDMGTIKTSPGQLAPGDVVLWKNTFSSMGGDKPGAITHVGIKGEGSDVYDHGMGPGWRKRPMWDGGKFAYGVTLSGNGGAAGSFTGTPGQDGSTGSPGQDGSTGSPGQGDSSSVAPANPFGGIMGTLSQSSSPEAQNLASFFGQIGGMFAMLTGKNMFGDSLKGVNETLSGKGLSDTISGEKTEQPTPDSSTAGSGPSTAGSGLTLGGASAGGSFGESALIQAMNNAGMANKTERAIFLAQMAHETGNFKYKEEIHDGSNYEGRSDLGNTQPGDGKRYKGRGYIQITGRYNYEKFGKMIGQDLVNKPELAADPNIAAQVALAYWKDRGISGPARQGDNLAVTKLINGGTNGLADRNAKYEQYKRQGLQTGGVVNMKKVVGKEETHKFKKLQTGGLVNMSKVTNKLTERMQTAQDKYNEKEAKESNGQPIVVTRPSGGGGQQGAISMGVDRKPPVLPEDCAATMTADYTYNVSLGGY